MLSCVLSLGAELLCLSSGSFELSLKCTILIFADGLIVKLPLNFFLCVFEELELILRAFECLVEQFLLLLPEYGRVRSLLEGSIDFGHLGFCLAAFTLDGFKRLFQLDGIALILYCDTLDFLTRHSFASLSLDSYLVYPGRAL